MHDTAVGDSCESGEIVKNADGNIFSTDVVDDFRQQSRIVFGD